MQGQHLMSVSSALDAASSPALFSAPMSSLRIRVSRLHMQTLLIHKFGFNQHYYTFALISLMKIVLCSKFHWNRLIDYMRLALWMRRPLPPCSAPQCRACAFGVRDERILIELMTSNHSSRRPERAQREGTTGPNRLDDARCTTYKGLGSRV